MLLFAWLAACTHHSFFSRDNMNALETNPDEVLTMEEAAAKLPCEVSASSLYRWALRGIAGVKLRSVKVGGKRRVRLVDLKEFLAAVGEE
jgi:excisionase family DNA binding protein